MTEPEPDPAKLRAAEAVAALVVDGMFLGLGSGTTASLVVRRLAERVRDEGLRFVGVATSEETAALATSLGLSLADLDAVDLLDFDIDGADEVDPEFRLIKGRGGALLREKMVAVASRRRAIVIGPDKRVERLGARFPVPVEVSAFGLNQTDRRLKDLGATTTLRLDRDGGGPFVTDGGNRILDCRFDRIDDPAGLDRELHQVVGVFETGLFLGLCDLLVIGHPTHAELIEATPAG